jgi:protein TonB
MEIKKKSSVNLEKFKSLFLLIGLGITLGFMLFVFNWTSKAEKADDLGTTQLTDDEEKATITIQEAPPPPPPPKQQQAIEVLNIHDDNEDIENEIEIEDADTDEDEEIEIIEIEEEEEEEAPETFFIVEQMPEFPGGELALRKYIAKNTQYPVVAKENDIQGKVIIQFEVTSRGTVGKIKVARKIDVLLDKEAVRVVKSLPKFKPGKQGGKAVNVWYTVPINFKLN